MTTDKNPHASDGLHETQALPPVDPTIELPVTPGGPGDGSAAADGAHDPDATQVVGTGRNHDDELADEVFRTEPTVALPVTPPTQVLPTWEPAPTSTQAYPVQDAPVDPEPTATSVPVPSEPSPAPAVDPAAQWNATAQQKAQHSPGPGLAGEDPQPRGLRVGTVVWGFVLVAVGAGILALALGATYDLDLALIALLSVAGLVLVVGSIVSSSRRTARERARR